LAGSRGAKVLLFLGMTKLFERKMLMYGQKLSFLFLFSFSLSFSLLFFFFNHSMKNHPFFDAIFFESIQLID